MDYEEVLVHLVFIRDNYPLTSNEQTALNYAIMAIKTLIDMKGN